MLDSRPLQLIVIIIIVIIIIFCSGRNAVKLAGSAESWTKRLKVLRLLPKSYRHKITAHRSNTEMSTVQRVTDSD